MKHICLNLKRFDVPVELGGINRLSPMQRWGAHIVERTQDGARVYDPSKVDFFDFLPEAHLLPAIAARKEGSPIQIGSQGVFRNDTAVGGNFGAFTTNLPANAVRAMGCTATLIGHCEERADKKGILLEAGVKDPDIVGRLLYQEVLCAQAAGLKVLFCIGESADEVDRWEEVLGAQLDVGLKGADISNVIVGYEPIWSIGPGKTPADKPYITKVARFIKSHMGGVDVIYGGGLKEANAAMLASIPEIDGGLIALTRFAGEIGFYPDEYLNIVRIYLEESERSNA